MAQPAAEEQPAEQVIAPQSLVMEEDVKATLRVDKGSDAVLKSWSVVDFTNKGDNYVCIVTSVVVKYSIKQENMVVVYISKLNPGRKMKELCNMIRISFRKEAEFYLSLMPELNTVLTEVGHKALRFPKCFYNRQDDNKEMLFLEDLRLRGFRMYDRRRGLDVAHATLIIEELGRLHAASCLLQAKTPNQDLTTRHNFLVQEMFTDETTGLLDLVYSQVNQTINILEKFDGYERCIAWIQSIKPDISKILKEGLGRSKYNVVCHGDCWINNVLFRYNDDGEPAEVMLIDNQNNRLSSPATDLNYFMYTSLNGDVRRLHLDTFLDAYYDTFTTVMEAAGVDMIFTRSEILQEFRDKNIIGVLFAMTFLPFMLTEPEDTPDLDSADMDVLLNEVKEKALKSVVTNPLLKPRFLEIFSEMMEIGLIP